MNPLLARAQVVALPLVLNLPPRVQAKLGGRPITDGDRRLSPELQLARRLKRLIRTPDFATLPLEAGRREVVRQSRLVGGRQAVGALRDLTVDGAEGPLPARLYQPTSRLGEESVPTLLFFHGGGFVYGDLASHDAFLRVLAETSGVQVLAIDYRLAPEHPYPAAVEDCLAAYRWLLAHTSELYADPDRLAVGGDSAGGNLAAVVANHAAREGWPLALQLLIYPGVDLGHESPSYAAFAHLDLVLTRALIDVARSAYVERPGQFDEPDASPLLGTILPGTAPAHVVTAGFDPLRDEGNAYVAKLRDAGVETHHVQHDSMWHGFVHFVGAGHDAPAYVREMGQRLGTALT